MKKIVFIASALMLFGALALSSCGTNAKEGKSETNVAASKDSSCCDKNDSCDRPCGHMEKIDSTNAE